MDSRSPYPLRRMELLLRAILDKAPALINLIPVNTSSGPAAELTGAVPGLPVRSLTAAITPVQSGSGDPSPENVRPISGWTGANIYATGVNIWDETWEVGSINNTTGANATDKDNIRSIGYISVKPGASLFCYIGVDKNLRLHWYDAEKTQISSETAKNSVVTVPAGAEYLRIRTTQTYGNTYNNDISINAVPTDTAYHPYVGAVYPVTWQTEAGTVYGGEINVTTGELTVDWWMFTVNENTPLVLITNTGRTHTTRFGVNADSDRMPIDGVAGSASYIKCDKLPSRVTVYTSDQTGVSIPMNRSSVAKCRMYISIPQLEYDTEEAVHAWLANNPLQILYQLNDPVTYQLTPTEVRTLTEGPTVARADTGDVSVTYHVHA